jgi:hypothetical protein
VHESNGTDSELSTKRAWPFCAKLSRKQHRQSRTPDDRIKQQPPVQSGVRQRRNEVSFTASFVESAFDSLSAPPSVVETISWKKQKTTAHPPWVTQNAEFNERSEAGKNGNQISHHLVNVCWVRCFHRKQLDPVKKLISENGSKVVNERRCW